jgi:hypothetical protein
MAAKTDVLLLRIRQQCHGLIGGPVHLLHWRASGLPNLTTGPQALMHPCCRVCNPQETMACTEAGDAQKAPHQENAMLLNHAPPQDPIPGQVPNPARDPIPDKPIDPVPDKPIDPTPDKPIDPEPDRPIDPTPDRPTDPIRLPEDDPDDDQGR